MKIRISIALTLLALLAAACSYQTEGKSQPEAPPSDITVEAHSFIDLLAKGDFAGAEQKFDPEMRKGLPADKLEVAWKAVQAQYGPFKGQGATRKGQAQGYDLVLVKCDFEKGALGLRLAFSKEKRIAGMFFDAAQ